MNKALVEIRNEYVKLRDSIQDKWRTIPSSCTAKYTNEYNLLIDKINVLIQLTNDLIKRTGEHHG